MSTVNTRCFYILMTACRHIIAPLAIVLASCPASGCLATYGCLYSGVRRERLVHRPDHNVFRTLDGAVAVEAELWRHVKCPWATSTNREVLLVASPSVLRATLAARPPESMDAAWRVVIPKPCWKGIGGWRVMDPRKAAYSADRRTLRLRAFDRPFERVYGPFPVQTDRGVAYCHFDGPMNDPAGDETYAIWSYPLLALVPIAVAVDVVTSPCQCYLILHKLGEAHIGR